MPARSAECGVRSGKPWSYSLWCRQAVPPLSLRVRQGEGQRIGGIGPKTALNILSGMNAVAFRGAVANGDVKSLSQISGVGKKTAERIVVELKDKIGAAGAWEASSAQRALSDTDQKLNDAVLALMALGFKQIEAHDTVRGAQAALGPQATVEELVRACLKKGA